MAENKNIILSAKDVEVKFRVRDNYLTAIRGVSLDLYEGETFLPRPLPVCWNRTERSPKAPSCSTART